MEERPLSEWINTGRHYRTNANTDISSQFADQLVTTSRSLGVDVAYLTPTPGHGNCFFEAICDQIMYRDVLRDSMSSHLLNLCKAPAQMRIVNQLRHSTSSVCISSISNSKSVLMTHVDLIIDESLEHHPYMTRQNAWDEYLNDMENLSVWAEDIVIQTAAIFLNRDIYLISDQNNKENPFTKIFSNNQQPHVPLLLGYIPRVHF